MPAGRTLDDGAGGRGGGGWRAFPPALWLALGAGLLARIRYFLDLAPQPWYGYPIVDSLTYDRMALGILEHGHPGAFFRPPLYPYFLSGLYAIFGHHPAPVIAIQFLLGLAALVPAFLLAESWFGRRAALVAAWIGALYPLRIFFEGELLDVTLFTFLFLWSMWLFWRGLEARSSRLLFWSGILSGAAVLTRPNLIVAFPFLLAGGYFAQGRRPGLSPGRLLTWILGAALAIAPATLHNLVAERAVILVAANGGVNFHLGNEAGATGLTPVPPGLRWEKVMQEPFRAGFFSLAAQERYWWEKARGSILAAPGRWLGLLAMKTAIFFNAAESSNNKALVHFTGVSLPVRHYRFWFGTLVCCAAVGLAAFRRTRGGVFLLWLLAGFTLSVVLFFVSERYRLPLVPLLAGAAAAGIAAGVRAVGAREWGRAALLGAGFCAAAVFVYPDWWGAGEERIDARFQMAQVRLMRREPEKALALLREARRTAPDDPDLLNSLGAAWFQLRDYARAEESYREALALGDFSEVWCNLGIVAEARGPGYRGAALRAYRRALEINPLESRARANLEFLEGPGGADAMRQR